MILIKRLNTSLMSLSLLALSIFTPVYAEQSGDFTAGGVDANADSTGIIKLAVSNFKNDVGKLYISVFNSKKGWLKEPVYTDEIVVIDNITNDVIATEISLPPGEYAISVHHDANGNEKMDSTFIGLPKEPVGLSNNQVPRFGPPKYKKSKFTLDLQHQENIKLLD